MLGYQSPNYDNSHWRAMFNAREIAWGLFILGMVSREFYDAASEAEERANLEWWSR